MNNQLGLDFGTANTRICVPGRGIILRAPSVIALRHETEEILATGLRAKEMIGRTPPRIDAIRPVCDGEVSNIVHAALLIGALFDDLGAASVFRRPNVTASIPIGTGENAKRALEEAIFEAGAGSVALVEAPIASAIGAGIRVAGSKGGMLIDIGAGKTSINVINQGGVIVSGAFPKGGDAFTAAVIEHLTAKHRLCVGELTAEKVKIGLGTVLAEKRRISVDVFGKHARDNCAHSATVRSEEFIPAFAAIADELIATIRKVMSATPPELSADLSSHGILLSGGGANLVGLPEYLSQKLGLRVITSRTALDDCATGLCRILEGGAETRRYIISRSH